MEEKRRSRECACACVKTLPKKERTSKYPFSRCVIVSPVCRTSTSHDFLTLKSSSVQPSGIVRTSSCYKECLDVFVSLPSRDITYYFSIFTASQANNSTYFALVNHFSPETPLVAISFFCSWNFSKKKNRIPLSLLVSRFQMTERLS